MAFAAIALPFPLTAFAAYNTMTDKNNFMSIITGLDRCQMSFSSLEDSISSDNEVRFIDAFVEKLDLQQLGVQSLTSSEKKKDGRAAFSDALFLKLYLYTYLNGIRSSRKLEREAIPTTLFFTKNDFFHSLTECDLTSVLHNLEKSFQYKF